MRVGKEGLLRRSFSTVPDDFFRLYQNDWLHLEVDFREQAKAGLVFLHTNIDCPQGEWQDLPFSQQTKGHYRLDYQIKNCGSYQFKLKYSLDGGATWFWDRVPFVQVIVDPECVKDIRMYTLILPVAGTLLDWTERLPKIAALGFNAVHLLPMTSLDVTESPYSAYDLFSIDHTYVGEEGDAGFAAFRQFVTKAQELGIRLCCDLVLNHIGSTSRMASLCPEWIVPDKSEKDGLKRSGCWHMNAWLKWEDLVKIYYDHPHPEIRNDIWNYMKRYALFWAHFANLTGGMIRLDNLHSSHEGFITELLEELRRQYPNLAVTAEFFTDSNTVLKKAAEWQISLFLANQWEYPYAGNLRNYIRYIHDIGNKVRFFLPITTHDTGAPAQLFGKAEAAVPRYAVTALMGTGQTGIVQGTEYGYPEKINFIGRSNQLRFGENEKIREGLKAINRVLASSPVFHQVGNVDWVDGDHGAVLGALRRLTSDDHEVFLIFANLDIHNSYTLDVDLSPLIKNRLNLSLENLIDGSHFQGRTDSTSFAIEPCGIRIFKISGV
jgi:1,4-alpha-glucan branching enzyme